MSKTWVSKPSNTKKDSKIVDASGKSLGRLASVVASLLSGKHKPDYSPHVPNGDFVVVVNSDKVVLTGKKWADNRYYTRSKYIGSIKEWTAKDLGKEELIKRAVTGMLPKNTHRPKFLKNLRVFKDTEHTYQDRDLKEYSF